MRPSPRQGFVVPTHIIRVHTVPQLIMHVTPKGSNREYLVASIPNKQIEASREEGIPSVPCKRLFSVHAQQFGVLKSSRDVKMYRFKFFDGKFSGQWGAGVGASRPTDKTYTLSSVCPLHYI